MRHGRSCNFTLHQIKIYPVAVACSFLPVPSRTSEPIKVFVSYARRDQVLCAELIQLLKILKKQDLIEDWHDGDITAGSEWEKEIETHLNSAQIILLLISRDFLASDYCYDNEMMKALERHKKNEACVIPIILRPCDWEKTPFAKLQALPEEALPVTIWKNQDEAFLSVERGIRQTVEQLRQEYQRKLEQIEQERQQQEQQRQKQQQLEQEAQSRAERERLEQQEEQRRLQQLREEQEKQRRIEQARWQEAQQQAEQRRFRQAFRRQRFQRLPWVSLFLTLFGYTVLGFGAASPAPLQAWAWALVWAVAWAVTWAEDWTWGGLMAWVLAVAWGGVVVWVWAVAWAATLIWAGPWAVAVAWAADRLLESFSKFHVFLILAATSTICLALGASIYWITRR